MHKGWLKKQVTIQEIEKSFLEEEKVLVQEFVPSDTFIRQWQDFKSNLQEGDELWRFSSPKDTWMNMCGRAGKVVEQMIKIMN